MRKQFICVKILKLRDLTRIVLAIADNGSTELNENRTNEKR